MPRPTKKRKVCSMPKKDVFRATGTRSKEKIMMSVDEYEAIRLIDYEELTQAQCSKEMDVSRATVQSIYNNARKKLSKFLVDGLELAIDGGDYQLCQPIQTDYRNCQRKCPNRMHCQKTKHLLEGKNMLKIAVTYENGEIFQHFGHTSEFKLYEVENHEILNTKVVDTNGSGHGALAGFLKELGVDVLICGGIGGGAQDALKEADIQLFGGVTGLADDAVEALISDNLNYNPDVKCDHHDHEHGEGGHTCGSHGCH